jgi:Uma2 family endonuclease
MHTPHTLVLPTDAPTVPGPPQGHWTLADWERLPSDGNRYEIIGGVLYMTTAPSSFHQWIINRLVRYIGIPLEDRGLGYSFFAPIGVLMPGCDPVQPDFVVVLAANASIIRERRIRGVPDLIVEVLSPGSRAYDEATKHAAYAAAGLPEYALVDPAARSVRLWRLHADGSYGPPQLAHEGDTFSVACLPGLRVPVAELFAGAPDTTL